MSHIIRNISITVILLFVATIVLAQEADQTTKPEKKKIETCEIQVSGVCKMCKKRIENAALIKGVKMAEWSKETGVLKVVYKTKNVTEGQIHAAIAEAGHDTDKAKAPDKKYSKLPKCCRYRDGVKVH